MPQYHFDCPGAGCGEKAKNYCKIRWLDWVSTAAICIIGATAYKFVNPPTRFFVERDPLLSYPYRDDSLHEVPTKIAGVLAAIPTLGVIYLLMLIISCYHRVARKDRQPAPIYFWDLPLLTLAMGIGLELLITGVIKKFHARYRPFFFAACNYKGYYDALATKNFTDYLANTTPGVPGDVKFCLNSYEDYHDATLSNPSGHAATIFTAWTILALTILYLCRSQAKYWAVWTGKLWVMFVVIFPFIGAELVTATRPRDYAHNFDDVLHGTVIGLGCGGLAFFLNYGLNPSAIPHNPGEDARPQSAAPTKKNVDELADSTTRSATKGSKRSKRSGSYSYSGGGGSGGYPTYDE